MRNAAIMENAAQAIADAHQTGIDLALVDSKLALSCEQRVLRHESALLWAHALREAGRQSQVKSRKV